MFAGGSDELPSGVEVGNLEDGTRINQTGVSTKIKQ
jgi:hypothetical protein